MKMEIKKSFYPEEKTDSQIGDGLTAFSSWEYLKKVLEDHFKKHTNERLIGIKADEQGLSAYFEYTKKSKT